MMALGFADFMFLDLSSFLKILWQLQRETRETKGYIGYSTINITDKVKILIACLNYL